MVLGSVCALLKGCFVFAQCPANWAGRNGNSDSIDHKQVQRFEGGKEIMSLSDQPVGVAAATEADPALSHRSQTR